MNAESDLRALWDSQGVPADRQDRMIDQIRAKAAPGAIVGPFRIPFATELTEAGEQTVIPGCEINRAPGRTQLDLFGARPETKDAI